jgi:hypothetical protein
VRYKTKGKGRKGRVRLPTVVLNKSCSLRCSSSSGKLTK